ncbi:hypothetical protein WME75_32120 [Sorangium sp. So ce1014]
MNGADVRAHDRDDVSADVSQNGVAAWREHGGRGDPLAVHPGAVGGVEVLDEDVVVDEREPRVQVGNPLIGDAQTRGRAPADDHPRLARVEPHRFDTAAMKKQDGDAVRPRARGRPIPAAREPLGARVVPSVVVPLVGHGCSHREEE